MRVKELDLGALKFDGFLKVTPLLKFNPMVNFIQISVKLE